MFSVTADALAAMTDAARADRPLGEIDDAHRRVYDAAGYGEARSWAAAQPQFAAEPHVWHRISPASWVQLKLVRDPTSWSGADRQESATTMQSVQLQPYGVRGLA